MEKLNNIIFYNIDKAIRSYRMYAMKQIRKSGYKITIDQWLIIKSILEKPKITQQELAKNVFKDNASVTRIIELMVKSNYLSRAVDSKDRRKSVLTVTQEGKDIIKKVQSLVLDNRKVALEGVSKEELDTMNIALQKIITNCL
ncbi:MarR family winged helix-turn-helix transcriptional regulator [Flavobacterium terrae]|uniref:Transcriptional regulator, MarR family n=1 Tax=Flavobacterium terrae TaxID=415425 RepID=A0A1M6DLB5_9FLAO|nr:MarR family transcriptional regulator [Flavobacterium terrae]SHI73985.1 transcriptional regulator, MarR family [Flavobacterium terrae]